jgi:hypothetical protein
MSYDLSIFFPHPEFPIEAWHDLLESHRSELCSVVLNGLDDCRIVVDRSVVSIGANQSRSPCAPVGTRWSAGISTSMGRSWRAFFIQFAIPYEALIFFPGVTVHDCQYHVGRSVEASSWTMPESWLRYAEARLWRLGPKQALIDLGLFHQDGRIRL